MSYPSLVAIEWLFAILVLIVFANRYVLGSLLRLADKRTAGADGCDPGHWPAVAVVVPVYNEGVNILATAAALAGLDYPRDRLSVLFVDDMSADDTYGHLAAALAGVRWMRVERNPVNLGKRHSIREAVRRTSAELVLSVDSDVIVEPNALKALVRHLCATKADAAGGCVFVSNADESWLTRMQSVKYWIGYQFLKNLENAFDHVMCLSGCLSLYRREALMAVEPDLESRTFLGDPVKYGEDRYLTRKIVERGFHTRLCFDARCYTRAPASFSAYVSQQLRWRRSNLIDFMTAIPHLATFNPLVLVHYASVAILLLFYPLFLVSQTVRLGFITPMIEHGLLVTVFAIAYERGKRALPLSAQTSGVWFLSMAAVFPAMYMTLTPLALATLGAASWETRQPPKLAPSG